MKRGNPIAVVGIVVVCLIVMWSATLVTWDVTGKHHVIMNMTPCINCHIDDRTDYEKYHRSVRP